MVRILEKELCLYCLPRHFLFMAVPVFWAGSFWLPGKDMSKVLAPNNPELMIVARAQKDGNVLVYSRGTFL